MNKSRESAGKLSDPETYAAAYSSEYEFEKHLTHARQNCCLRFLSEKKPNKVLEVGCGPDLLTERLGEIEHRVSLWHLVEPSRTYGEPARQLHENAAWFDITFSYLEDAASKLKQQYPDGFDAIIMSGVLHETTNPEQLLLAAKQLLADDGWLLVIVPNANSWHRLLAVEIGLIENAGELSLRNRALGQPAVYDSTSLRVLLEKSGFHNFEFHGYMHKLFANSQMAQIVKLFGVSMVEGLERLGQLFPDNAAEFAFFVQKTGK